MDATTQLLGQGVGTTLVDGLPSDDNLEGTLENLGTVSRIIEALASFRDCMCHHTSLFMCHAPCAMHTVCSI
jgi:hypothetical protein